MTMTMTGQVHDRAVVVEAHNDLLMLVSRRPPHQWGHYFRQHWLPQLTRGGVDVQVLPVFVDDDFHPEKVLRQTLRMIEAAHRVHEENSDVVALCTTGTEITQAVDSGRVALLLALEGCAAVQTDLELLTTLHRLGVRMASFTHMGRTPLADGSGEDAAGSLLTSAGVAALAELERLGIIFDVSHLGQAGVEHALEIATRPVVASHSSARALRDHHRNLADDQLRGVAGTGGVVCVNFLGTFLTDAAPTVDHIIDHVAHIVTVAGVDHVGLGPDFVREVFAETHPALDGAVFDDIDVITTIPEVEGPAGLPRVTRGLLDRGFVVTDVEKIIGGNLLRLFSTL